jgi:CRP/FNR family transcriptional regulator, cyclic AMP receptor protein
MSRGIDERLKRVPLFSEGRRRDLEFIGAILRERTFPNGAELTTEDQPGDEFMIILDGTVTARRHGKELAQLGPGDFFGEMALLDQGPRTATITADTAVTVGIVGPREWQDLLAQPGVTEQILRALAHRLRDADLGEL